MRRAISLNPPTIFEIQKPWEIRILSSPEPGKIRMLLKPPTIPIPLLKYWYADMSLTEWVQNIVSLKKEIATNPITRSMSPPNIVQTVTAIFEENQRARWLASIVLQRWKTRVWKKKTQCNVDLIDMADIKDKDAIFMTDTTQRQTFRFHRRDVFRGLIANICMSEEMMAYPRPPTNIWTNVPLTLAQTISICAQLVMDYAKRGLCPPVLLSAFCAAGYDLIRFKNDNASLLSHHAINSYFKDLTDENKTTVYDTVIQLLSMAGLHYSLSAINRWLSAPRTPLHNEWLLLVRDYTLYINLHIQVRPSWISTIGINYDIRALYARTTEHLPERRVRVVAQNPVLISSALQTLLNINVGHDPMDNDIALMLINSTIFH